jgi:hypothetical protein
MNLPDDPKERKKLYVAFGMIAVSILYVGIKYGMEPLMEKRKNRADQVAKLEDQVYNYERKIKKLESCRQELSQLQYKIVTASERQQFILHHNLGNYRLVAESTIMPYFKKANVKVTKTNPVPFAGEIKTEINSEGIPNSRRFIPFGLGLTCSGSFLNIVAAIDALERSNPYLSISSLNISSSPDPQNQEVKMLIEWPIWITDDVKLAITTVAATESS